MDESQEEIRQLRRHIEDLLARVARLEQLTGAGADAREKPEPRCLAAEDVHDAPKGGILVRPWGERSFYAEDPWNNPLCFVEEGTVYTGRD